MVQGKRILVVDDEEQILRLLSQALKTQGWIVFTATSLQEATAAFRSIDPSVLLTDLSLKGMNDRGGLELLQFARKESPSTRVIIFSGFLTSDVRKEATESGAYCLMEKPVDLSFLLSTIDGALGGNPGSYAC
jgi:DNA-binding NtrC family response regulator